MIEILPTALALVLMGPGGLASDHSLALNPAPQEGGEEQEEKDETKKPPPEYAIFTPMEKLAVIYGEMNGGLERLRALKNFSFDMIPHRITKEGPLEQPAAHVDMLFNGETRHARISEELEGRKYVKIGNVNELSGRTWVDGQEREIPELLAGTIEETQKLFELFDLLYKPDSSDFRAKFKGERKRGEMTYLAADYEFHPSRLLKGVYRLYYGLRNPDGSSSDGTVMRIDHHAVDPEAGNPLQYSIFLSDYTIVNEIRFPGRLEWRTPELPNKKSKLIALWRFENIEVDNELPMGHFTEL